MANQDHTHNGPTNIQTIEQLDTQPQYLHIGWPVLTQQITADFQVPQEVWNKLSSQINKMAKTNKLLEGSQKHL